MGRALVILVIVIVALLVAGFVAVEVVLRTDYPRQRIEETLREQTGLQVDVGSLSTGWGGNATIEELTFSLPLEQQPLLTVPVLEVDHTGLLQLIIGRPVDLNRIIANQPHLRLRSTGGDQWNVLQAIEIIQRTQQRDEEEGKGVDNLPEITIKSGVITVQQDGEPDVEFSPLEFEGRPDSSSTWQFTGTLQQYVSTSGRFVPRRDYKHEITFDLNNLDEILSPLMDAEFDTPIHARGRWVGNTIENGVRGDLQLDNAEAFDLVAAGQLRVRLADNDTAISTSNLRVEGDAIPSGPVAVSSAAATLADDAIRLRDVVLTWNDMEARLAGRWDLAARSGSIDGRIKGLVGSATRMLTADVHLEADAPGHGPMRLIAHAAGNVRDQQQRLTFEAEAEAGGKSFTEMAGSISTPRLRFDSDSIDRPIDLSGLALEFAAHADTVELTSLTLPMAKETSASAMYNVQTKQWQIDVELTGIDTPQVRPAPIDFALQAEGDGQRVDFSRLQISGEQFDFLAAGSYLPAEVPALQARAAVEILRPDVLQPQQSDSEIATGPPPADGATFDLGHIRGELDIAGSITPLDLAYDGTLLLEEVPIAVGEIESVSLPWSGRVTAERGTFASERFELLDGRWQLDGTYEMDEQLLDIQVDGADIMLNKLATMLELPLELAGSLQVSADIQVPGLSMQDMTIDGEWAVADFTSRDFVATSGAGRVHSTGGIARMQDIRLEHLGGELTGEAEYNQQLRNRLDINIQTTDWPVGIRGSTAQLSVDSAVDASIDLVDALAWGELEVYADLLLPVDRDSPQEFHSPGWISLTGSIQNRDISINELSGELLDGTLNGRAQIPLDRWTRSQGELQWDNLNLEQLAQYDVGTDYLDGQFSGTLTVEEGEERILPDSLKLNVDATFSESRYREIDVRSAKFLVYTRRDRVLLESSRFELADGTVDIWGRLSQHDDDFQGHMYLTIDEVDLDQIIHTFAPDFDRTPGLLSGRVGFGGYLREPHRMFGSGQFTLAESDLGALPVFSDLYNLIRLEFDPSARPTGVGSFDLRLEGNSLEVPNINYFNRGTDVVGSLTIRDIWKGGDSDIRGVMLGAVRPFRDLNLPIVLDIDRVLQGLQAESQVVDVSGTLADPNAVPTALADVTSTVERMLRATTAP